MDDEHVRDGAEPDDGREILLRIEAEVLVDDGLIVKVVPEANSST